MKQFLLLLMTICISLNANAQLAPAPQSLSDFKNLGTSRYEVRYSFKFKKHKTDKEYLEDIRVLQIGNELVKDIVT